MDLFDPSSATYIWKPAVRGYFWSQLHLYKWHMGWWWVYSDITGWRKSLNNKAWFRKEKAEGFFLKLTKEERGQLAKAD